MVIGCGAARLRSSTMSSSPVPAIRNLRHTTVAELALDDNELAEFRRKQAEIVAVILSDPEPNVDDTPT